VARVSAVAIMSAMPGGVLIVPAMPARSVCAVHRVAHGGIGLVMVMMLAVIHGGHSEGVCEILPTSMPDRSSRVDCHR
jgi:hypothetical protein